MTRREDDKVQEARERFDFLEKLGDELTATCVGKVRAFATERVRMMVQAGHGQYMNRVDELVSDAIADTALGVRTWDPDKCKLSTHLCGVIKSRTHHGVRLRHVNRTSTFWEERDDVGRVESAEDSYVREEVIERLMTALHELAYERQDDDLVAMLAAMRRGVLRRNELAKELGVPASRIDFARRRLTRLLQHLPQDIYHEALELMRSGE